MRDLLRGVAPADWDVATNARPDRLLALFPGARYENRFGTVAVTLPDGTYEVTTFRRDGTYSDHRRPDDVTFGETLDEDLARRDFTVNAMAIPLDAARRAGHDRRPVRRVAPTSARESCAPSAIPRRASARTPCGCCGPCGSWRPSDLEVEPATREAIARECALAGPRVR